MIIDMPSLQFSTARLYYIIHLRGHMATFFCQAALPHVVHGWPAEITQSWILAGTHVATLAHTYVWNLQYEPLGSPACEPHVEIKAGLLRNKLLSHAYYTKEDLCRQWCSIIVVITIMIIKPWQRNPYCSIEKHLFAIEVVSRSSQKWFRICPLYNEIFLVSGTAMRYVW